MKFETDKSCEWVKERIDAFLDDDLSREDGASLEAHLAQCYSCREELDLARQVRQEISALPQKKCPQRVISATLERIQAESSESREQSSLFHERPWLKGGFRLAFIAAALVVVIWISLHEKPPVSEQRIDAVELAEAERQFQITLAYVGYVSSRSAEKIQDEVVQSKIAPAVQGVFEKVLDSQVLPFTFFKSGAS